MSDKFNSEEDEGLEPSDDKHKYTPEDFEDEDISDEQKYYRNLYEDDGGSGARSKKVKKKSKFKDKDK